MTRSGVLYYCILQFLSLSMSSSRDFSSALGVSVDPSLLGKRRSGNVACQRGMEARELQRAADSREY